MGQFRSGKHLRVRLNGGVHRCESVRIRDTTEEFETTNSESDRDDSAGEDGLILYYESEDTGVSMCELTVIGKYDLGESPLLAWKKNVLIDNVQVYVNGIDADPYDFPKMRVLEWEIDPSVKGPEGVPFRLRAKNHGVYTPPAD